MSFTRRLRRLFHTNAAASTEAAEAAVDLMQAHIQENLLQARLQIAQSQQAAHRLASLTSAEQHTAQRMYLQARYALKTGREVLAREALWRALRAQRKAERYRQQWQEQSASARRLLQLADQLDVKYADLDVQRQQYALRGQLARTRRELSALLYGDSGRVPLDQAKSTAITEEIAADAYGELLDNAGGAYDHAEVTADEVDRLITQLRQELLANGDDEQQE